MNFEEHLRTTLPMAGEGPTLETRTCHSPPTIPSSKEDVEDSLQLQKVIATQREQIRQLSIENQRLKSIIRDLGKKLDAHYPE